MTDQTPCLNCFNNVTDVKVYHMFRLYNTGEIKEFRFSELVDNQLPTG